MLADATLVAFVGSADLDRARVFYEETLGLLAVEQTSLACVFAAGPMTLRVTAVDRVVQAPYTVLGWSVADIEATVGGLALRGIACRRFDGLDQDPVGIWSAPSGARVAWFADPDGNILSVTQLSA